MILLGSILLSKILYSHPQDLLQWNGGSCLHSEVTPTSYYEYSSNRPGSRDVDDPVSEVKERYPRRGISTSVVPSTEEGVVLSLRGLSRSPRCYLPDQKVLD